MGKVYRAEQAPLARVCALKILSPRYDGDHDPEFRRRFFLEASTAAKLTHGNTVTIFDYGKAENEDIYYIAMEYIEGRTLSSVLQEAGHFPEERVRHIAAQICRSLREAHSLGVVHRDLKPGNIMLTDTGDERDSVKVLDFGLVKDVTNDAEDHTQEGLFMGSPKYMAPEQILGLNLTPRADVYSLGIMLYQMLTGKVPYDRGGASVATLMAHVNEPLPSMHSMFPKLLISPQMEAIVYRCLEKDPGRRYESMSALLLAVKGVGEDGSIDLSGPFPAPRVPFLSPDSMRPPGLELRPSGPPMASVRPLPLPAAALRPIPLPGDSARPPEAVPVDFSQPVPIPFDTGRPMPIPVPRPSEKTVLVRRRGLSRRQKAAIAVGAGVVSVAAGAILAATHSGSEERAATTYAPSSAATAPAPVDTNAGNELARGSAVAAGESSSAPASPRVIHVESDPPGAAVSEEGKELCSSTPCDVTLAVDSGRKDHWLTVAKKEFGASKPVLVDPSADSISVTLVPTGAAPQSPRKKSDPQKGESFKPDPYKPDPYQ